MGKRGPAPKPTALRLLHGDRKDRINDAEPVPSSISIAPPDWLDGDGLAVWQTYAPDLIRTNVLTAWDTEAFACLCDSAARRARAVAELESAGEVIELPVFNKNGDLVGHRLAKNPWALVLTDANAQLAHWAARFGMTPSDRAQLKVGEANRAPGADLLSG